MKPLILKPDISISKNKKLRREFTKRLATKIKDIRKLKGLTQQELANASGLHLTYVSHLELATYHPTVFVLWKISKALHVSLSDFIT